MTINLVSVNSAGDRANNNSFSPSISANARFVTFSSNASNLVPGDTNNKPDIFVRDTLANTTTLVSVNSSGDRTNGNSSGPSMSADGRFVAFASKASNLVPGDTNNNDDIFVHDLLTNDTTLVSVSSSGAQANGNLSLGSLGPSISANGQFVAFASKASNLVPGDTNNTDDIFVRDLSTNTTNLVSVSSSGDRANGKSYTLSMSANGRFVAFASEASNLTPGDTNNNDDIFVRDLLTNDTTLVSVSSSGDRANGLSSSPSISADGRFVAFVSDAANLVPGDTNNNDDIFVRDLLTNNTTLVSVSSSGDRANGSLSLGLFGPSISANGRFVAFASEASNLVAGDTNNSDDIFVRDLSTNTTTRVSVSSSGAQEIGSSFLPYISADGRFVAFASAANLVPGNTNDTIDIFVADTSNTPGGVNNTPNAIGGTLGNDNLTGTSGNDNINGFDGDDTLTGRQGNDLLVGGSGSDNLFGGKGFDVLNGGAGNDNLVGGAGNDLFILGAGLGIDTIFDFTNGQDLVQLIGGLTFGQLSISAGSNGTLIKVARSGEILAALIGIAPNSIGSEDFLSF
jgi:Ca2+-binding RTX toxin-like protein